MIDMYANGSTDPGSISYVGINDATNVMTAGNASMMMNWPFMWKPASDPATSKIVGKLGTAILPAGPAGTASIDGTDAWTIANTSANPELAMKLIEFYLDPEVQTRQVLDTGWLPIRLSVLEDPEVQKALPNAAVVLEQAQHPYDSFVTPDYNEVTQAIGTEIQRALQGEKTAEEALRTPRIRSRRSSASGRDRNDAHFGAIASAHWQICPLARHPLTSRRRQPTAQTVRGKPGAAAAAHRGVPGDPGAGRAWRA